MLPTIALVGRPNVGKSTLFNRLTKTRNALVADFPGLTRDRHYGRARAGEREYLVVDTGGFEPVATSGILHEMAKQAKAAIAESDVVVFIVDGRSGLTAQDATIAGLLRKSGRPVVLVVNKSEGLPPERAVAEFHELALGAPLPISAAHGENVRDMIEIALDLAPRAAPEAMDDDADRPIKVAIVGRPNVGKSTLVNAVLGEERMITGPEAGITRDAISSRLEWQGRSLLLFDTAGLRRKMRVEGKAEELSVGDALKAIRFAEVVVLTLDAEQPFEKQDLQIADLIEQEGRALVIAVNKWDLVRERDKRLAELREKCTRLLPQIKGVGLVPVSAMTGQGLDRLMQAVLAVDALWNRRLPTHALNRWLQDAVDAHPPPAASGRRIKLRYMTQANARPPTFVLFCSRPKALPDSYVRYLVNSLRDSFDLPGVPIRLHLRKGDNPYA